MTNKGKLFLIPNTIAENTQDHILTPQIREVLPAINHFVVENIRSARRFLSSLKVYESIERLKFDVLDKNTNQQAIAPLMSPIEHGLNIGIISESGCPGIADPGALAVKYAHEKNYKVVPLVGPSSITMALMASGLNGQRFCFHGYLPIDTREAGAEIKTLEKESKTKNQTQIFIETPYRNNAVLQALLKNLRHDTLLTIAQDITGHNEFIQTRPVAQWIKTSPFLEKAPAVFLFLA